MQRSLVTYSLVRALYDEGKDYIDSFWPFAVRVLPADGSVMTPQTVADLITERFSLVIPVHTVQTLLERAKGRGGLVVRRDSAYALTAEGTKYVHSMETQRNVERRVESFLGAAREFLALRDERFSELDFTRTAVERVIEQSHNLFGFVVERRPAEADLGLIGTENEVLSFFQHVEACDPAQYSTLRDLILGTTIAGLLRTTDVADATRSFRPTTVYLDTNFILSLLGLRFDAECRTAHELIKLLNQSLRFSLKVFDFTLEEIFALLRGFGREEGKYPIGIRIRSLYASMKVRGYTPASAAELIATIDGRLAEFGVTVLKTGVRIADLSPLSPEVVAIHHKYKPDQDDRGRLHDLHAIDYVANQRRSRVRKVEDAEVFFLTEDMKLSNYAFVERGHRDQETISEVMPDRLLTNLLWLKSPELLKTLPVETVIAMHSRDLFIDHSVWLRFFGVLQDLQERKELDPNAASVLLYNAQVHKDLALLGASGALKVDDAWVLARLDAARKETEDAQKWALESLAKDLEKQHEIELGGLSGRIAALEGALQKRNEAVAKAFASRKEQVRRDATRITRELKLLFLLLVVLLATKALPLFLSKWDIIEPIFSILPYLLAFLSWLGLTLLPRNVWTRAQTAIEDYLMERTSRDLTPLLEDG